MALFRRKRRAGEDEVGRRVVVTDDLGVVEEQDEELYEESAPEPVAEPTPQVTSDEPMADRATAGPFDRSEVGDEMGDRLDLGALWLGSTGGAQVRIEIDQNTGDVQAVTTEFNGSAMQVQAFAAPRSTGIWRSVRTELADGVLQRGGAADEQAGPLGLELLTRLPARGPDGRTVYQVMRFVGVDGPRWFLRGVISGPAASDDAAAEPFYAMIRNTVVLRGDDARPPREMLPLRLPRELMEAQQQQAEEAARAQAAHEAAQQGRQYREDDLKPFERGPEITETR